MSQPDERSSARKEYKKQYYEKNKDYCLAYEKARTLTYRQSVLDLLGHKCAYCGFEDERALHIDHMNGGGTKERQECRNVVNYYKSILAVNGIGYQILCANCNAIKMHEQNEFGKKRLLGG